MSYIWVILKLCGHLPKYKHGCPKISENEWKIPPDSHHLLVFWDAVNLRGWIHLTISKKSSNRKKKSSNQMETKLIFASVYLVPSFGFSWRKNLFVFELAIEHTHTHTHTQTQKLTLTSLSFARCEVGCSTRTYLIRTFYFDKRKMFTRYLLVSNLFWGTKLCLTIWSNRNYHLLKVSNLVESNFSTSLFRKTFSLP